MVGERQIVREVPQSWSRAIAFGNVFHRVALARWPPRAAPMWCASSRMRRAKPSTEVDEAAHWGAYYKVEISSIYPRQTLFSKRGPRWVVNRTSATSLPDP